MSKQQQSLVPKIWVNYGLGRPHVFFTAVLSYPKSFSLSPLQLRCYFFTISTEVILGLPISPFILYNLNQITISPCIKHFPLHMTKPSQMTLLHHILPYMFKKRNKIPPLCWRSSIHKGFEDRTYYRALACKGDEMFPWKSIWKPIALTKVAFFLWAASMGKILTVENLSKRHIILMSFMSWCCVSRR